MTNNPSIDWLLDCDPRPAQIEATFRSYHGLAYRNNWNDPWGDPWALPHAGRPASGWGHFMQMRTGKTPTALNEFMLFRRDFGFKKSVVFAPSRYKDTWPLEWVKFGVDTSVIALESRNKADAFRYMDLTNEGAVIVNYEALRSKETFSALTSWIDKETFVVADESVLIKNPQSGFFKQINLLQKDAGASRALTGLPTPQGPFDIWTQLRFCRQLETWNFHPFKYRFTKMGGFKNKVPQGLRNEEELDALLFDVCFRAKRRDWSKVEETEYASFEIPMTNPMTSAYEQMDRDFVLWLESGDLITTQMVITKRMKLQQISSGFIIDEEGEVREIQPFRATPKFKHMVETIDNEIEGKVIVIAHYQHTLDKLYTELSKYNPALIAGKKKMTSLGLDAEAEKKRFNESSSCRVMLGQSQAIKYGHTLMGNKKDPCLTMFFYENNYSLDNRAQTEERPQGEGQMGPLLIVDYYSSPIEKDIVKALQRKKNVAEVIMTAYK